MKKINITLTIIFIILLIIVSARLHFNKRTMNETAELSLKVNTQIPVYVTRATYITDNQPLQLTGKVISDKEIPVIPQTQGIVTAKYKKAGDPLRKGEAIAQIDDDIIRRNLQLAELNLAKAEKDVQRYTTLLKEDIVTRSEMENVEMTFRSATNQVINLKEQLKNTRILSPANGILEKETFETGSLVSPAMPIAEVIDPRNLKAQVTVTEKELPRIHRGSVVTFTADALPAETFSGIVDIIGTRGDQTLSYAVEIQLRNPYPDKLKPGMHIQATIHPETGTTEQLAIDRACISGSLKSPYVYLIKEGKAYRREITIGQIHADKVTILDGITPQDTIVRSGQINLKDGANVILF